MQGLKRSIPRVATATLVLGGGGCAAKGAPTPLEVGLARCEGLSQCAPAYFSSYWTTVDECANEYASSWEMETPSPDDCDRARLVLQKCIEDEYRESCDVFAAISACADEQERATRICSP